MKWLMIFLMPFVVVIYDDILNITITGNAFALMGHNVLMFIFGGLVHKWMFAK